VLSTSQLLFPQRSTGTTSSPVTPDARTWSLRRILEADDRWRRLQKAAATPAVVVKVLRLGGAPLRMPDEVVGALVEATDISRERPLSRPGPLGLDDL